MSARALKQVKRAAARALTAKAAVLLRGSSPISASCQIPELREKYAALGLPKRGVFVEVGGYDGESFSNTSFLADEGWRGVYIEPIPSFCRQIRLRHVFNRVGVEEVAISDAEGVNQLSLMGALTTLSDSTEAAYKNIPWAAPAAEAARSLEVRTATLGNVLSRNNIPHGFDLMIVDVEGYEETVIAGLLETPWRPRVLIVELIDLHPDFVGSPELQASARRARQAILANGYDEFYADPVNSIFQSSRSSAADPGLP